MRGMDRKGARTGRMRTCRRQSFADTADLQSAGRCEGETGSLGSGRLRSSIFSRAIGLNALFIQPPAFDGLAEEFLRSYHRYADFLYQCYIQSEPHRIIASQNFNFELYASGEYSRMLETEWGTNEDLSEPRPSRRRLIFPGSLESQEAPRSPGHAAAGTPVVALNRRRIHVLTWSPPACLTIVKLLLPDQSDPIPARWPTSTPASARRRSPSGGACSPSPVPPTWSASATWTPATGPPTSKAARASATACSGCWSCRTPWPSCCRP